jgi:RNA polymerase sigma-70 factor, ECF subfamily
MYTTARKGTFKRYPLGRLNAFCPYGAIMIPNATQTVTASRELELVRSAARGDRRCFEELVQSHIPTVQRMIRRIVRNESDVEDVIQEAILKAFIHLPDFRSEARFGTWFYRIAANQAIHLHRVSRTWRFVAIDDIDWTLRDPLANAEERLEKVELCRVVKEGIGRLPAHSRAAVRLFHFEGLSVIETAQRLGLSEAGVKTRLVRARSRLGRMLEGAVLRSRLTRYGHR